MCINTGVYIHTHTQKCPHLSSCTMNSDMHTHMDANTCTHKHVDIDAYTHGWIHMHILRHIHAHTHMGNGLKMQAEARNNLDMPHGSFCSPPLTIFLSNSKFPTLTSIINECVREKS